MASVSGRPILASLRSYSMARHILPRGHHVPRVAKALCSSSAKINNVNSITSETSPDTPKSYVRDSSFEQMHMETSQIDMPIEMHNPYEREKICCLLCKYNIRLDFKNARLLSQFVSPYTGKIYGRNITRLCQRQQAELEREVEKSINAGYMAVKLKNVEFLKDPKLFDPNNPLRPHNY
ncbi:small ribosomal subunit protein bS18m [Procambarus clarkii]|uniref:small ribosomal subunit protein bS18m n=1 Tax=Procambarus clarkii TaxID=6728 RepID=UPI001E673CF7|nr:28S ribosomal protein S18c, mitochondrial-like [Procambarus clarkii]